MDNQRNTILAVILSALVLFGWSFLSERFFPTPKPPVTRTAPAGQAAQPSGAPAPAVAAKTRNVEQAIASGPRIAIRTPKLTGSINLTGAVIDDLVLPAYRETIKKESPPIRLLSPAATASAYLATFGWSGTGIALPGSGTVWTADAPALTPTTPVTMSWANSTGQTFRIKLSVDADYMFTAVQSMTNASAAPVTLRPYAYISRDGVPKDISTWTAHTGPIGVFGNGVNYDIDFANLKGGEPGFFAKLFGTSAKAGDNYFDARGGWLGFADKYWLTALIPDQNAAVHAGFRPRAAGSDLYQADMTTQPVTVAPGAEATTTSRFFAGAKEVAALDGYEAALGIPHFGKAIDWGWYEIVEKPIFKYLSWLFHITGNFGVAILLLTLTVRVLMFPVAQRQFASMAGMRVVQPKMKALQERYKDDKPRLQQEMMALYKAEKVNPLAGCLPVLIQVPIFFALYKVLLLSIEMRHQPFVAWIKDLSAPDPLTPVNLFGALHFTPPGILAIGVLPILFGITMWFQMKLSPPAPDPAQQQIMMLMPWMMIFFFAPLAAGLQLYYVFNNLLTLAQQRWFYAKHPVLKQAVAR